MILKEIKPLIRNPKLVCSEVNREITETRETVEAARSKKGARLGLIYMKHLPRMMHGLHEVVQCDGFSVSRQPPDLDVVLSPNHDHKVGLS